MPGGYGDNGDGQDDEEGLHVGDADRQHPPSSQDMLVSDVSSCLESVPLVYSLTCSCRSS